MMKRSKESVVFFMVLEAIITIMTVIGGNYTAALGWGFLFFTNAEILLYLLDKNKNDIDGWHQY